MEQQMFMFHVEQLPMPEHPIVILQWIGDCVVATWPEFQTYPATFRNWRDAFAAVLSPLNDHVCVKVHA